MADSRDSTPPLTHRLVGGLQWAVTGAYLVLLGAAGWAWYLRRTRTVASLDLTWLLAGAILAGFVAGFVWVGIRPVAADAHARRIEVVVTLLVAGFVLPVGASRLLGLIGVARSLPMVGFAAGYALALALSYGLVYGLGTRFFLGPDPEMLRE